MTGFVEPQGERSRDQVADASPVFAFGEAGPEVLITASLHGWETTAIAVAWELSDHLARIAEAGELQARITIVPLCNPQGTLAMCRLEPETGKDLNRLFPVDGRAPEHSALASIAQRIADASLYIDLHSAGAATYWPHVLVTERERLDDARGFGLRYVLLRGEVAGELGTSLQFADAHGVRAFCLEIGGGTQVEPAIVRAGVDSILRFLGQHGLIRDTQRISAESSVVYPCDPRRIIKSKHDGIFYAQCDVGSDIEREEVMGYRIGSRSWRREPIVADETGCIIYLRNEARVHPGSTLAMILPPREAVIDEAKPTTVFA